jgi:predicted TPR repeat methyltransferase
VIAQRPRNGRSRAQLALLLSQQQAKQEESNHATVLHKEAMKLANEAIQVAPSKPFGHVVKSMIVTRHEERMSAIRQALQVMEENERESSYSITKIELWIRLLLEPRRHDNEMRREFNQNEKAIYDKIVNDAITTAASNTTTTTALGQSHYHLGTLFRKMNPLAVNQPRARHHFGLASQLLPESHRFRQLATFWLATLFDNTNNEQSSQTTVLSKCPPEYIVGLYSTFAQRFDELLVTKLSYQTPTLLKRLVKESLQHASQQKWARRAADLGCGTGLSGMAFRETCQYLVGVDLSSEMIEKAREKKIYDDLVVGDVTCILSTPDKYDFIFSCDVLVYIGDLNEIFAKVYSCLVDNGVFAFSTELLLEDNDVNPYKLHECARFAHKESYILSLAQDYSFQVLGKCTCAIRKNKGKDVRGLLVVLRKGAGGQPGVNEIAENDWSASKGQPSS